MDDQDRATRLARITERERAATPGPWVKDVGPRISADARGGKGWAVATINPPPGWPHGAITGWGSVTCSEEDAEFIAASREDVPFLLAEVDRLAGERDRARTALATLAREAEVVDAKFHALGGCRECGARQSEGHYGMCALYGFQQAVIRALAAGGAPGEAKPERPRTTATGRPLPPGSEHEPPEPPPGRHRA